MADSPFTVEQSHGPDGYASATFSDDRAYRYGLTRTWDDERPPAVFVMLNPSTADGRKNDATITRCTRFAQREGCGGLIAVNLFALRATRPVHLREHPDPVGAWNDGFIREHCRPGRLLIAAWGVNGAYLGRDEAVLRILADAGVTVNCLGMTAGGAPRHPLYLPAYAPVERLGARPWLTGDLKGTLA
jgi:hypothetical protein